MKMRRGTIAKILREAGLDPSPERRKGMPWKEFLERHWEVMAATDFFTVEVWTAKGLIRYHLLFIIRLLTREAHIAGVVPEPSADWMNHSMRNLAFLLVKSYLAVHSSINCNAQAGTLISYRTTAPARTPASSGATAFLLPTADLD